MGNAATRFPDYRHVNYYYLEWTRKGIWDQVLERVRELARVAAGKAARAKRRCDG